RRRRRPREWMLRHRRPGPGRRTGSTAGSWVVWRSSRFSARRALVEGKRPAAGQPRTLTPRGRRPAGVKGHDPGRRQWPPFAVRSPHLQHGCPCFRAVTILVCPPRPMARLSYPARPFRRADTARNNPDAVIPLLAARFWIAPGKPRPRRPTATPCVPVAERGRFSELQDNDV